MAARLMAFNINALETLGINSSKLDQLSEKDQTLLIRKKWLKLLLKHHPDRNPNNPEAETKFKQIMAAFEALSQSVSNSSCYLPDINHYFSSQSIEIPPTAFDYHLREGIERSYDLLMDEFATLTTEEDKRSFAEYYAPFLNIYDSLPPFDGEEHGHYFMQRINETLLESMIREWRELVIRTYGKELLSDFKYRHALATGHLYPILAMYKLLSPFKALSLLINGILILPSCMHKHISQLFILHCTSEFNAINLDFNKNNINIKRIALLTLKIVAATIAGLSLFLLPMIFLPLPVFATLICLPLISHLLTLLASPINMLARPLANRLGMSPKWLIVLAVIASPLLLAGLIYLGPLINILTTICYLTIALNIGSLASLIKLNYEIFKLDPIVGFFNALMTVAGMVAGALVSLVLPIPISSVTVSVLSAFFISLASFSTIFLAIRSIQNIKINLDEISGLLPLPTEEISKEVEEATLLGCPNATAQSNRFFNTPKDAECLPRNDYKSTWKSNNSRFFSPMADRLEYNIASQNNAVYLPNELLISK